MTATEQLADMEDRIRAGVLNAEDHPHLADDLTALRDKVAAEQRIKELGAEGRAEQQQADADAAVAHRRQTAIHQAQQLMADLPDDVQSAAHHAIRAILNAWDTVVKYGETHDRAVQILDSAHVPFEDRDLDQRVVASTGDYAGVVDPDNRVVPAIMGTSNLRLDGRDHVRSAMDPGTWMRYIVREAARQRDGMPTNSFSAPSGTLERAVGNVDKPHLPRID